MHRPLWAVAGVALLGTVGVTGVVIVASSGGEEELLQQPATATGSPAAIVTPTISGQPSQSVTQAPTTSPAQSAPVTPAPGPEGWLTYTEPGGLFTLSYPSTWFQSDNDLVSVDPSLNKHGVPPEAIDVEISTNPDDGQGCGVLVYELDTGKVHPANGATLSALGGISAWRLSRLPGDSLLNDPYTRIEAVSVIYKGYCVSVAGYFTQQNPNIATLERIIETFKFSA